ncbi:Dynein heavy chain 9, axonemal [Saguinus oedipus]|uniref:Dynein heavy chain 9, axonemal n=1 Tax=Saguinus oedipus TaxID=9490 RepID=A0ABQ9VP13_SAGOE|nr:Dynein heavy chain 9, axonemal [Saguinus oedipus]
MARLLDKLQSSYFPAFKAMYRDVVAVNGPNGPCLQGLETTRRKFFHLLYYLLLLCTVQCMLLSFTSGIQIPPPLARSEISASFKKLFAVENMLAMNFLKKRYHYNTLAEAQDIHVHLMPLQRHLETLENAEFPEVKSRLQPLLHVVCLIWATCKCYRSPGRLTVLLQEICNLLIQQASNYLSPEDLLRSEVEESQRKLQVVSDTLSFFKQVFQDRRENLHTYFKENQEVKEWDFQSSLVFVRLDNFLGRLHVVEKLVDLQPLQKEDRLKEEIRGKDTESGKWDIPNAIIKMRLTCYCKQERGVSNPAGL